MTYKDICRILKENKIEDYAFEARVLLEELCGGCSEDVDYESDALIQAVEKRITHYPLQYILGKWWFYDCEFYVDENCLIPRADTEILVEVASRFLKSGDRFCDLCAGSGCIGITLLHMCEGTVCDGVEKYEKTLQIAIKNAEFNKVADRYNPVLADVFDGDCISGKYAAVISNPPYIRREVMKSLSDEVKCEPYAALDGGVDGLDFYRAILDLYIDNLGDGGRFFFEIGYDQGEDLRNLAAERGLVCEIVKDYSGNDRVAVISRGV